MKQVTFIHAADLHLDSPMIGLKHLPKRLFKRLQESTFKSLEKIIDAAIEHQVDFVIFAGDIFDGEDRSIRAQTRFKKQIERLSEHRISVFIIHGNHDHLGGKWAQMGFPENCFVFPKECTRKILQLDSTLVSFYGFSYDKKNVVEKRIDEYQKVDGSDFHIGLLHGQFEGNSDHGKYAPFTLKDLLDKQFDYWALGHIHKRMHLFDEPPIIYPGNIQGRNKKETGEKGCYLVTLTEVNSSLEFISTADCVWEEVEIDASSAKSVAELYRLCRKSLDDYRKETVGTLLLLSLKNVALEDSEKEALLIDELLESLQDEEKDELISFVWPVEINIEKQLIWGREELIAEADFYEELFQSVDTFENIDECLAPLFQTTSTRKFITQLQIEEKTRLVKEAEEMLVQWLKKG